MLGRGDNVRGDHGLPFTSFSMDCSPARGAYRRAAGLSQDLALPLRWLTFGSVVDVLHAGRAELLREGAESNVQPCTSRASKRMIDRDTGLSMMRFTILVRRTGHADVGSGVLHEQQYGWYEP